MPPTVALLLTLAFIGFLFRRDFREQPNVTAALWLPLLWMFIICSRPFGEWLRILGLPVSSPRTVTAAVEEGSPLDALFFALIIAAGIYVLHKRQVRMAEVIRNNGWLAAFLLYCLISLVWSDFPLIAFKRWTKILGHPIMVLVLLTEPDVEEAVRRLMKRCAYVILPVSILFIKYYPRLGREFDPWGVATTVGITKGKNLLGAVCTILGFFLVWHLFNTLQEAKSKRRRNELLLIAGLFCMTAYNLHKAHSSTALGSLILGSLMLITLGMRFVNKRFIGTYMLAGITIYTVAELTFGISEFIIEALGRNSTLTGRTEIWAKLLQVKINPIFGTGFESFWLGDRLQTVADMYWWYLNEAHNGYLETYLNLGIIGLFLLVGLIIATFWNIRPVLWRNFEWGRYRLGFLTLAIAYNWTEAGFRRLHPVAFVFYLIAVEYPNSRFAAIKSPPEIPPAEDEELVASQNMR